MNDQTRKRQRRSPQERLVDLERKQQAITEKLQAQLQALEAQKQRIAQAPSSRKELRERQMRFERAAAVIAPGWDQRHMLAAMEMALNEDEETLRNRGEKLMEEHGKGRRGRRAKPVS